MRLIVAWACRRGGAAVRHCRKNLKKKLSELQRPLRFARNIHASGIFLSLISSHSGTVKEIKI